MNSKPSLTNAQRDAVEAARAALAAEQNAPAHTTGPEADGVWRDHFRRALAQITVAFHESTS